MFLLSSPTPYQRLGALCLLSLCATASAFDFSYNAPTQCDNITVTWSGGAPPFELLVVPTFGSALNYSIPPTVYDGSQGTFSTQLTLNATKTFLLAMSHSAGLANGGISQLLTVGPSQSGGRCDTSDTPSFTFTTPLALQQCGVYNFTQFGGAVLPVTVKGFIPLGQAFTISSSNMNYILWDATDLRASTTVIFIMTDAKGRSGGSTDALSVGSSSNSQCISGSSPSSTATSPTGSLSGSAGSSGTSGVGAIVGGVLGGLLGLAALILIVLYCMRRKRSDDTAGQNRNLFLSHSRHVSGQWDRNNHIVDLMTTPGSAYNTPSHLPPSEQLEPNPFILPPSTAENTIGHGHNDQSTVPPSRVGPSSRSRRTSQSSPGDHASDMSSAQRKRAMAGYTSYAPHRFILHTDAEDEDAESEVVVELPPLYTDRQASAPDRTSSEVNRLSRSAPLSPPIPPMPAIHRLDSAAANP